MAALRGLAVLVGVAADLLAPLVVELHTPTRLVRAVLVLF